MSFVTQRLNTDKPISLAVLAMGGQGGGVLSDWIVALAESCGWCAQSTSVPGVAQRTGATIYYIEMLPAKDGKAPVLSLMPSPGDVDIVLSAELMEAGRSMLRGLVTPDKTVLIASTHRSFAVVEKEKPGDGASDPNAVIEAAGVAAQAHDRLRHGGARRQARQRDFGGDVRRARRRGRSPLSARGLRKGDRRGRQGNRAEPQSLRRRFRPGAPRTSRRQSRCRPLAAEAVRSALPPSNPARMPR